MKKFLLFALVAILGISAQAQGKPEVIKDQPAGSETVYKRVSGKMFAIQSGKINIFTRVRDNFSMKRVPTALIFLHIPAAPPAYSQKSNMQ